MPGRPLLIVAVLAAAGGLSACGGGSAGGAPPEQRIAPLSAAQVRERTAGAPEPLAAVHRQGNQLLRGGKPALQRRLADLRGYPVVLNVWGSWCVPCRTEFPIFQRVSVDLAKRVAFLGIATQDPPENAAKFLRGVPVPFPSFLDFDGSMAKGLGLVGTPSTIFYDRAGKAAFLHQGQYTSAADLEADIAKYGA